VSVILAALFLTEIEGEITMPRTFKQLAWKDRIKIESMLLAGGSPKEIASRICCHISTVYREIKRGEYEHTLTNLTTVKRYSPEKAQARHDVNQTSKGAPIKLGKNHAVAAYIENKILKDNYSPAAICALLKSAAGKKYNITFCRATIYSYIDKGIFLHLTNKDLPENGKRKREYKRIRAKMLPRGKSIEERPDAINARQEPGHWEMDTILGKANTRSRLLVLSERFTRREIIIKIPDGQASTVVHVIDKLERRYGKHFKSMFKTITVDNGSEFSDYKGLERSAVMPGSTRLTLYYCHPYSAYERGTNENINRMIRRRFPKGTDFGKVTQAEVKLVEQWINGYPREILGYKSALEVFENHFQFIA
jgi:IS30 family transposase